MGVLPRYMVIPVVIVPGYTPTTKYLSVSADGTMKANGDFATSPACKFELERAKTRPDMFNIRSCFNNKYWAKEGPNSPYIKAGAAEPNEDVSSWSCTLVQPEMQAGFNYVFFRLFHTHNLIAVNRYSLYHSASYNDTMKLTVVDRESLITLPKQVAFKSAVSGKYLAVRTIQGEPHLQFNSDDIGDPRAAHEIIPTTDGRVQIKSKFLDKLWRRNTINSNWIMAKSGQNPGSPNELLFMPVKVSDNTFALRFSGNDAFCHRLSANGIDNCVAVNMSSITHEGRMNVEEIVLSRTIFNVNYRLHDARIYDTSVLTMVTRQHDNYNTEPETTELTLAYAETSSRTWDRSVSASLSVTTTISTGIPFIVEGKVEMTATLEGAFSWSKTTEHSKAVEVKQTVTVPPMTRVKTSVVALQGKCNVPFSYTVRDVLADSTVVTYTVDDGVYNGANNYNFRFVTTKELLSRK